MSELSYTNRDIKALRDEMINYAKTLTSEWTDFNESDLMMVFIELMTGVADMLNFYIDKQALECFIGTVKQRKNGKGILELIGYKFNMTKSCECKMQCKVMDTSIPRLTIPKYTIIKTNSSYDNKEITYLTKYPYTIEEGTTDFELDIIQGTLVSSKLPVSDFPDDYKIYLDSPNVASGSIVFRLEGEDWEEVPDVVLDDIDGKKFSVNEDKNDICYIQLHSSYKNYLPLDNTVNAEIYYLESLGSAGKIPSDGLVHMIGYVNGYDLSKIIGVGNKEASSGGANRESLDLAKKRAVNELYTMKTAVVLDDYSKLAETIPGILHAKSIDWSVKDSKYITVPYVVDVYLIPENEDYCSSTQIEQVSKLLEKRKSSTITVNCKNSIYNTIDIEAVIHTTAQESLYSSIKNSVIRALEDMFDKNKDNVSFGSTVSISKLNSVIYNSNNYISYADIISPSLNVVLEDYEYPKLGTVTLSIER